MPGGKDACFAAFACAGTTQASGKWLVIAGSNRSVSPALNVKKKLERKWPSVSIIASNDCQALAPDLFLTVAGITSDRASAETALVRLKMDISDAYVRECRPKDETMLMFGLPVVDASIEQVPVDAVNWSDKDRLSTVVKLPQKGYLWIRHRYVADPNDAREGRRQSVLFFDEKPDKTIELKADCPDPHAQQRGQWITFDCAREVAGDNLLHETVVVDLTSGKSIYGVRRCRNPQFVSDSEITCQIERVNADGQLSLQAFQPVFR